MATSGKFTSAYNVESTEIIESPMATDSTLDLDAAASFYMKLDGDLTNSGSGTYDTAGSGGTVALCATSQPFGTHNAQFSSGYIDTKISGQALNIQSGAISIWFKGSSADLAASANTTIFGVLDYDGPDNEGIQGVVKSDFAAFDLRGSDGVYNRALIYSSAFGDWTDDEWHHYVGMWNNASGGTIWIDGVCAAASTAMIYADGVSNSWTLYIGASHHSTFGSVPQQPMTGGLDDFRFYPGINLTSAQIQELYLKDDLAYGLTSGGKWYMEGFIEDAPGIKITSGYSMYATQFTEI